MTEEPLDLTAIRATLASFGGKIRKTPIARRTRPDGTEVVYKQELFQETGTFKARGALSVVQNLAPDQLGRGVTAVSAGNHAIATAWAAKQVGASAKVVMIETANPFRIAQAKAFGAEVELSGDAALAFARVEELRDTEGRYFVHPFDGYRTILGTATCGLEFMEQAPDLDAVVIPIGGGGLCAGMAAAIKLVNPDCTVFGVEPEGADSMTRSFASGKPEKIEAVRTIADSLGAPFALPYSFGVCKENVDEIVLVSDDQLRDGMRYLFETQKLACEPACAATTAALNGPLSDKLAGKRVGLVLCGSNIDVGSFAKMLGK